MKAGSNISKPNGSSQNQKESFNQLKMHPAMCPKWPPGAEWYSCARCPRYELINGAAEHAAFLCGVCVLSEQLRTTKIHPQLNGTSTTIEAGLDETVAFGDDQDGGDGEPNGVPPQNGCLLHVGVAEADDVSDSDTITESSQPGSPNPIKPSTQLTAADEIALQNRIIGIMHPVTPAIIHHQNLVNHPAATQPASTGGGNLASTGGGNPTESNPQQPRKFIPNLTRSRLSQTSWTAEEKRLEKLPKPDIPATCDSISFADSHATHLKKDQLPSRLTHIAGGGCCVVTLWLYLQKHGQSLINLKNNLSIRNIIFHVLSNDCFHHSWSEFRKFWPLVTELAKEIFPNAKQTFITPPESFQLAQKEIDDAVAELRKLLPKVKIVTGISVPLNRENFHDDAHIKRYISAPLFARLYFKLLGLTPSKQAISAMGNRRPVPLAPKTNTAPKTFPKDAGAVSPNATFSQKTSGVQPPAVSSEPSPTPASLQPPPSELEQLQLETAKTRSLVEMLLAERNRTVPDGGIGHRGEVRNVSVFRPSPFGDTSDQDQETRLAAAIARALAQIR